MIPCEHEMYKILSGLDLKNITITKYIIQLLYDNCLFNSFPNKDQVFEQYLTDKETFIEQVWKNNTYFRW